MFPFTVLDADEEPEIGDFDLGETFDTA